MSRLPPWGCGKNDSSIIKRIFHSRMAVNSYHKHLHKSSNVVFLDTQPNINKIF